MKKISVLLKKEGSPDVVVLVPAHIVGALAVHHYVKGIDDNGDAMLGRTWAVTHRKTGLSAARNICFLANARAVAKALQTVPGMDWDADDVPAQCSRPELGKRCLEAIEQHRYA